MRTHTCHVPGCNEVVKRSLLMCFAHWRLVSKETQIRVNKHFNPRQIATMKPSKAYLAAARKAIEEVQQRVNASEELQSVQPADSISNYA